MTKTIKHASDALTSHGLHPSSKLYPIFAFSVFKNPHDTGLSTQQKNY